MEEPDRTLEVEDDAYRGRVTRRRRTIALGLLIFFAVVPVLAYAVIELVS